MTIRTLGILLAAASLALALWLILESETATPPTTPPTPADVVTEPRVEPRREIRPIDAESFEAAAVAEGGAGRVVGTVKRPGGQPVRGAQVILRRRNAAGEYQPAWREAVTDAAGAFSIRGLHHGRFEVDASHEGQCAEAAAECETKEGALEATVALVLTPGVTMRGHAFDAEGGAVPDLAVHVAAVVGDVVDPVPLRRFAGDASGRLEMSGLRAGCLYALTLADEEWRLARDFVSFEASSGAPAVTLKLWRNASVSGVVLDSAARPVAGARVEIDHERSTIADAAGRFRLHGLRPAHQDRRQLWGADEAKSLAGHQVVLVRDGDQVTGIELQLQPLGVLVGRVAGEREGLSEVQVQLSPPDPADDSESANAGRIARLLNRFLVTGYRRRSSEASQPLKPPQRRVVPNEDWGWLARLRRADDPTAKAAIEEAVQAHPKAYRRSLPGGLVALSRSDEWEEEEIEDSQEWTEEAGPADAEFARRYARGGRWWFRRESGRVGWRRTRHEPSPDKVTRLIRRLKWDNRFATCDAEGSYRIEGLWPGEYALVALAEARSLGLPPLVVGVSSGGETRAPDLALEPPRSLEITISGPESETALHLKGTFGSHRWFLPGPGIVSIEGLAAGRYEVAARAERGLGPAAPLAQVVLDEGACAESLSLAIDAASVAALHVWLSFADERIPRRIDMFLSARDLGGVLFTRQLDSSNAASFEALPAGRYDLKIQLPTGRVIERKDLVLEAGASRRLDVTVSAGASLRGTIAGELPSGCRVRLSRGDTLYDKRVSLDGSFSFSDLEAGRWHLLAWARWGGVGAVRTLDLLPGQVAKVTVQPRRLERLEGVVTPVPGVPPAGRAVRAEHLHLKDIVAVFARDKTGRFLMGGLPPGRYRITAFGHDDEWLVDVPRAADAPPLVLDPKR